MHAGIERRAETAPRIRPGTSPDAAGASIEAATDTGQDLVGYHERAVALRKPPSAGESRRAYAHAARPRIGSIKTAPMPPAASNTDARRHAIDVACS
jgi:hypothetical protein